MPWFKRSRDVVSPAPPVARTPEDLGLPGVEKFARAMLLRAGLDYDEIERVRGLYPTDTPPNPDHTITAGDPPNPWTLSCLAAEQMIWDTLNACIKGRLHATQEASDSIYAAGGLDAMASFIFGRVSGTNLHLTREVLPEHLFNSLGNPNHALWSLVHAYVRDYWVPGVGPIIPK